MKPVRLLRELKKVFPNDETKKLKLFQVATEPEIERRLVREWKYTRYFRTDLSTLANEIYEAAQCVADETGEKERFEILGIKSRNEEGERVVIVQEPDTSRPNVEPTMDGLVGQLMAFTERAYTKLDENLAKQAEMQRDLMNSYHKRLDGLEKREEILSDIVRTYRDMNADREDRIRRDERIDRVIEVTAGYFVPTAAEKMLEKGIITPETAARLSAAAKDISEDISPDPEPEPPPPKIEGDSTN